MAKAKRGGSRGTAANPRGSSAGKGDAKEGYSAAGEGAYLSDGSDDFLPLDGEGRNDNSSEDESAMLREMGLEGAEDATSEEEEESDDDAESNSQESGSDQEEADDASSDSSGEEESRTAWGRRAKDFYGDSSSGESSDDEEEMKEKMAEAVRVAEVEDVEGMTEADFGADARSIEALQQLLALQHKTLGLKEQQQQALQQGAQGKEGTEQEMLWKARLDAEVEAILDGFSASAEHQQQQKPQAVAAGLGEEELKQIVATAHPELHGLLKELQDALKEINNKVEPLVALAKRKNFLTKEGVSLLDAKNQLLLSYLSYLSYYIVLKAHGVPVASHPVVERLIESRLLLQKLRPIEAALKPQLERLLADGGLHAGAAAAPRARPDSFAAVGESDDEQQQDGMLSGEEESTESGGSGAEEDAKGSTPYKPPKMVLMEYTGDKVSAQTRASRELQRAAERLKKSEMVRAVREMTSDAPEEIGIERFLAAQAHRAAAREAGLLHGGAGEEDEEQFELMRRSLSKKERKAQAAQRAQFERRAAAAVGSTLEDLAVFYEQPLVGEEDGDDELGLRSNKGKRMKARGVLGHYLNAAKQAAEEAAKTHKAQAEKLIIARQQNLQHLSRRNTKDIHKQNPRMPAGEESEDEEFAALVEETKKRKSERKQRMQEKAEVPVPHIDEEVDGQRRITREMKTNRGLVRKRKKFEGNARVHNRMKYQQKTKKLKSLRQEMRPVEDRSYSGEVSGIRSNLKRSRTLH
ncbi:uncharacterized protein EMH_0015780 [Eimeria mitis]|uniref:Sas10 C-terminal domain-containing protein n=1 Tax=Eimeria mitis TaxID=44415 RepID=U6KD33_9EIME|nr:uncharacterized protein EMH_0015780 [Eimeria mitis]CDJ33368.1 hypothetical protein, conserved [Eimeria mitis]